MVQVLLNTKRGIHYKPYLQLSLAACPRNCIVHMYVDKMWTPLRNSLPAAVSHCSLWTIFKTYEHQ